VVKGVVNLLVTGSTTLQPVVRLGQVTDRWKAEAVLCRLHLFLLPDSKYLCTLKQQSAISSSPCRSSWVLSKSGVPMTMQYQQRIGGNAAGTF
jgi:hypothetical protein